jgi:hypothetical protein
MVPYGDTQIIVATQVFMTSTEPHRTRHWVEGELYESEISYVKQGMREAIDTEEFAKLPELQEKLTKLRGRKVTKGHWYYDDTGMTVGGHFATLDAEGKREYLRTRDIRVEKASGGIHVVIDGEDHGVFPYLVPHVLTTTWETVQS